MKSNLKKLGQYSFSFKDQNTNKDFILIQKKNKDNFSYQKEDAACRCYDIEKWYQEVHKYYQAIQNGDITKRKGTVYN